MNDVTKLTVGDQLAHAVRNNDVEMAEIVLATMRVAEHVVHQEAARATSPEMRELFSTVIWIVYTCSGSWVRGK